MVHDFHTHTFLSDGVLLPIELIRRAIVAGYQSIGITDHASASTMEFVIAAVRRDCELAQRYWGFRAVPGVELTHVPAAAVGHLAREARRAGAKLVIVHGETPVEPVEPGTNLAALRSPDVDLLAHPGYLTDEEAALAAANGIFLEITAKPGHSLANGHVAAVARKAGAAMLVNSDGHTPTDLLTAEQARRVAVGAGLSPEEAEAVLRDRPLALLERISAR
jgi:histidinol phosphatase-like PHP family hydrolase